MSLGLVFFGWGLSLAVTSVWVAPILTRRMPRTQVLWIVLPLLALDLLAAASVLIAVVILGAGNRHLARANGQVDRLEEAEAIGAGDS